MALPDRFHDHIYIVAQGVGSIASSPPGIIDLPENSRKWRELDGKMRDVVTDSSVENLGK
jgi:hypothetical protein